MTTDLSIDVQLFQWNTFTSTVDKCSKMISKQVIGLKMIVFDSLEKLFSNGVPGHTSVPGRCLGVPWVQI